LEDTDFSRLLRAISILGLDRNWVLGVIALCAQEIAIRKKLESLGITAGDQNFQKVAELLVDRIKQMGEKPPDILLSLARAYPAIRGKLVHFGYKTRLYSAEAKSIVENTIGLIETLFHEMPTKTDVYQLAEMFLNLSDSELMLKIPTLDTIQREKVVLALIERYSLLDWNQPGYYEMREKIRRIVKSIIKSFKPEDMASLLDVIIQRFSTVTPDLIMEILGEVGALSPILNMLQEKNYTNWIIQCFVTSRSFDNAGINARVIANVSPILNDSQIEQVFKAILENDQVRYSYSAEPYLINFIAMYSSRVNPNLSKRAQKEYPPK